MSYTSNERIISSFEYIENEWKSILKISASSEDLREFDLPSMESSN